MPLSVMDKAQLAGGAADLGLDIWNSAMSVHEARQNRRFQRNMSNTAHQRAVKDLKKAGLNPVLAAGGPASTPSGSTPSLNSAKGVSQSLGSVADRQIARRTGNAQAELLNKQAEVAETQKALNSAQTVKTFNEAGIPAHQIKKILQEITESVARVKTMRFKGEFSDTAAKHLEAIKDASEAGGIKNRNTEKAIKRQIEADVKLQKAIRARKKRLGKDWKKGLPSGILKYIE